MNAHTRTGIAAITVLAAAGLMSLSNISTAQNANAIQKDVLDIAAEIKKGNNAKAKQMAAAAAKKIGDLDDLMHMYHLRGKGGMGWGSVPLKKQTIDGIARKLGEIAAKGPDANDAAIINKEVKYWTAAIAEITKAMPPPKAKKNAKEWTNITNQFDKAVAGLGNANGAKQIQAGTGAIIATCNSCHTAFK